MTFNAGATDATSGVSGAYDWDFGDNTAHGSGTAPTHTYTQAGTYVAKASTSDGAGNAGQGTVTITVTPASGGTTTGGTPTTPGGSPTTGGTTTTTAPPPATTSGGGTVTAAPSPASVSQQAGGGGTQRARVGGLSVVAPKRLTLAKTRKKLPMVLTVDTAGTVEVSLLRGAKIASRGSVKIARAGTLGFSLKLPKRPRAGGYTLKLVFRPTSGRAATKTLHVTFVKARATRSVQLALRGIPLAR
ncbi:MAG TPA: PKD domain-containing protein [Baekduia sp.]|nr:PKD domain-containing protein [Baekduia sp.]